MIKKLNEMSLGQLIFTVTMVIVGLVMTFSIVMTNQLMFKRTDSLIESTSKEINKQVIMNYENYLSSVIDISNALQKYIVDYTQSGEYERLDEVFENVVTINTNIRTIALLDKDGQKIASSTALSLNPYAKDLSWFIQALSMPDIHHFSGLHTENLIQSGTIEVFTVSKLIQYNEGRNSLDGILMIDIDTSNFRNLANQTNLGENGHIIILDQGGQLIYSSNQSCLSGDCESAQMVKELMLGGKEVRLSYLNMYMNVNTIKNTRWKIATFINVDEIVRTKDEMVWRTLLVFGATLMSIALASWFFARRITQPMNQLKQHISKIEEGDFESHVQVKGQKEVVLLGDAFNSMSNRVNELMHRVVEEQNEKRKTHFVALQNQIQPHFLYNTLDMIVSLSEKNQNKDVAKAIIALSKFFRMSISNQMNLVDLKDEIEHVRNYLLIQQIRYRNQFVFELEIDPDVLDSKVIKLSLQPLVENAIIHGINLDDEHTLIRIKAYRKDDKTILEVFNEGYGLSETKMEELMDIIRSDKPSQSMGLKNVYQRLKLYYGNEADLLFESVMDEYTKVILVYPYRSV